MESTFDLTELLRKGELLGALRVECHPAGPRNAEVAVCSICGELIWLTPRAEVFLAANPCVVAACCHCLRATRAMTHMVSHGRITWRGAPIPDLGHTAN